MYGNNDSGNNSKDGCEKSLQSIFVKGGKVLALIEFGPFLNGKFFRVVNVNDKMCGCLLGVSLSTVNCVSVGGGDHRDEAESTM